MVEKRDKHKILEENENQARMKMKISLELEHRKSELRKKLYWEMRTMNIAGLRKGRKDRINQEKIKIRRWFSPVLTKTTLASANFKIH